MTTKNLNKLKGMFGVVQKCPLSDEISTFWVLDNKYVIQEAEGAKILYIEGSVKVLKVRKKMENIIFFLECLRRGYRWLN